MPLPGNCQAGAFCWLTIVKGYSLRSQAIAPQCHWHNAAKYSRGTSGPAPAPLESLLWID